MLQNLNKVPEDISKIRENKDLSDDETSLIGEVEEYTNILDKLIEIYKEISDIYT